VLSSAILAVIAVNAALAFAQEQQAARAVEALAAYLPLRARVIRDGAVSEVPATDLVVGDVLLLAEGDRVSADSRLINGALEVDMSALSGESAPVTRSAGEPDLAGRLIDAPDAVFSGTVCTAGEARGCCVRNRRADRTWTHRSAVPTRRVGGESA
jgi:magnesium-transporting ATPase (P-type)